MEVIDFLSEVLPLLLLLAGLVLLIVLIIIAIKLVKTMNKIDDIVDEVDEKVQSIKKVFGFIDFFNDKIASLIDRLIERVTNWLSMKSNKNKEKEEE